MPQYFAHTVFDGFNRSDYSIGENKNSVASRPGKTAHKESCDQPDIEATAIKHLRAP